MEEDKEKEKEKGKNEGALDLDLFKNKPLAERMQCVICNGVPQPEEAMIHRACGKLFCKNEIEKWLQSNPERMCPQDRQPNAEIVVCRGNDPFVFSLLSDLELHCPISSKCPWVGELGNLSSHCATCDYTPRPCRYSPVGCSFKGDKGAVSAHLGSAKDLHLELYEKWGEDQVARQKTIEQHLETAQLEIQHLLTQVAQLTDKLSEASAVPSLPRAPPMVGHTQASPLWLQWNPDLANKSTFVISNDGRRLQKSSNTTYSIITKAPLPKKATWKISVDQVGTESGPEAGFGIATNKKLGPCSDCGGYLTCNGAIGVSLLNSMYLMKGDAALAVKEVYLCSFDSHTKSFSIMGNKTNLKATIDARKEYFIFAQMYAKDTQITLHPA